MPNNGDDERDKIYAKQNFAALKIALYIISILTNLNSANLNGL